MHNKNGYLIQRTFRKLGLSLAPDGSEDARINIKDLPDITIGDWARQPTEEEVEQLAEQETLYDAQEYDPPANHMDSSSGEETTEDLDLEYDLAEEID